MGHLTLISEDVISALEHYPPDLRLLIAQFAPQPAWDDYVTGRYNETKKKDTSLLGGGKPVVMPGAARTGARWKVDEEDSGSSAPTVGSSRHSTNGIGEVKGEFRRVGSGHPVRESSADFKPMPTQDEEDEEARSAGPPQVSHSIAALDYLQTNPFQFARYLAQEMQSSDQFGSPSSDTSDDEDEDGGWLAHSTFDLGNPPVYARRHSSDRRPLGSEFDVSVNVRSSFDLL